MSEGKWSVGGGSRSRGRSDDDRLPRSGSGAGFLSSATTPRAAAAAANATHGNSSRSSSSRVGGVDISSFMSSSNSLTTSGSGKSTPAKRPSFPSVYDPPTSTTTTTAAPPSSASASTSTYQRVDFGAAVAAVPREYNDTTGDDIDEYEEYDDYDDDNTDGHTGAYGELAGQGPVPAIGVGLQRSSSGQAAASSSSSPSMPRSVRFAGSINDEKDINTSSAAFSRTRSRLASMSESKRPQFVRDIGKTVRSSKWAVAACMIIIVTMWALSKTVSPATTQTWNYIIPNSLSRICLCLNLLSLSIE
jgi:hypothetical protein